MSGGRSTRPRHLLYQRETINPGVWAVFARVLNPEGFLVAPKGAWPSLSTDGTLAFVRPSAALPDLVWVDRSGGVVRITTLPQGLFGGLNTRVISLSPEWQPRPARPRFGVGRRSLDVRLREQRSRLSHTARAGGIPLWMPDGAHVVLAASFSWRVWNLYRVPIGGGPVERLTTSDLYQFP
jgi:hypothetical protein